MMKKKTFQNLGFLFIISGIIFLLVHNFIVTGSRNEPFARDLFGFPIPHPPVWTSYIPYIGFFIGIVFEFFSVHGLVGIVISSVLFYIGGFLLSIEGKQEVSNIDKESEQIRADLDNLYQDDDLKIKKIK